MAGVPSALTEVLSDRYLVERELGHGGMAIVYLARDLRHGRQVAIKVLRGEIAASVGSRRFLREIEIAAQLTHPHILPLHDSGEAAGFLYYVMPFVEGESLRERLRRDGRLPVSEAVRIVREVADGLAYAHARGVVHRDVKPGNILLEAGHAVVTDFGIARALTEAGGEELTITGLAMGTPLYMSPEQVAGGTVDHRSDIYSLGCVLYELLSGNPPFSGPTPAAVAAKHVIEQPPSLSSIKAVPFGVAAAVATALAKAPDQRFPDATQFAEALDPRVPAMHHRRSGRWPRMAGVIAALTAVLLSLLVAGISLSRPRSPSSTQPAWILVADFDGPPDDRNLPRAVRELIAAELDQSRSIATLQREQIGAVLRDAGLSDTLPLTGSVARELAVRSSVRAILTGSVLPVAQGRYSVVIRVGDVDSGRNLLTVTSAASDQDIIPVVQSLAGQIRRGLGERRDAIRANKPLIRGATPSFAAYRKYVEAFELSNQGQVEASNRLLREAIALDTLFASAWGMIGHNYLAIGDADSAGAAIAEALRRPQRLTDAQRYRLEADAAYALRHDRSAAVRWYDLLLQVEPQSITALNNRATLLYGLGRHEEALAGFARAEALEPFGVRDAQIEIFNQVVTLLALDRANDAETTARKLSGVFGNYAAPLLATFRGHWSAAESLSAALAGAPSTPDWIRVPAVTMLAGALTARGAVVAADRQLRAAANAGGSVSRLSFVQASLLLSAASGRALGRPPDWLRTDSTPEGLVTSGTWAAMAHDTIGARRRLTRLQRLPPPVLRRLGFGPQFVGASILAAQNRWREVVKTLGAVAVTGDDEDGMSNAAIRWQVADAYKRLGRLDSAAAFFELAIAPTKVPFGQLPLRGLVWPFAERQLAISYGRLNQARLSRQRWQAFTQTFVTPDPDLKPLMTARE